jgi:hypothetical protein
MENQFCELCKTDIDMSLSLEGEWHADEAGYYHQDCYDAYSIEEARYWGARYYAENRYGRVDESGAYEWRDPKNPTYTEWVIDNADNNKRGV